MELKFSDVVIEKFCFLQSDYGFKITGIQDGPDEFSVIYVNSTTKILIESISWGFNARVAMGGALGAFENYDLGDLVSLVSHESKISDPSQLSDRAERLNYFANMLRRFGSQILIGNFEQFPHLKDIAIKRKIRLQQNRN
ncbi:MAG: hypothetical protein EOO53_16125 [Gammaproteobacteria bacterium]|nr:MAG: hypothetical protein EOO53_16125 [Gammaproteobacteria bacterium]